MAGSIGTAYINIAPNMSGVQGKIASGLRGSGSDFTDQFAGEVNTKSSVIMGAIAGIAASAATKGMDIISSSISAAVKRVDTLNAAQKTFQYMGFAAGDAKTATTDLTTSIQGLPTPLDSAMRGMTALAATYGDVKVGQKVFSALNDAVLGFGGTADMVDGAVQQLSQLPMDGPLDAQTWNSLRNSGLTPVMVAMAKDMGTSVGQMKADFGSGKLTVQDFTNELMKMDKDGGGGLTSLKSIAGNATSGIGTGFANMQTAVTRGLASIIQAIGQKNISGAIASVGKGFETVLKGIVPVITFIASHSDIFAPIAIAIGTIVTALTAWVAVTKIMTITQTIFNAVMAIFNAVMAMNPIGLIVIAIAALVAGLVYFFTQTKTGQAIWSAFVGFLTTAWEGLKAGFAAVGSFFAGIWTAISGAISGFISWFGDHWRLIIAIVLGPLGLLIDFVTAYWGQITGAISAAVGFIWNVISTVFNAIAGFMGAIFGPPINAIVGVFQWLGGIIGGVLGGIWNGITGTLGAVLGFLGGVGGKIMGIFSGAGSWLLQTGKDLINGLINGASSLLSKIGSMFLDIIPGWIKTPFKKALGINSPSTVFAGFGDNITQGLINGVVSNASGVSDAVGSITNAALSPLNSGINSSSSLPVSLPSAGSGGSNSNQTVTIGTVVLQNQDAAKEFFNQLNQDTINVGMGLTPVQGAYN